MDVISMLIICSLPGVLLGVIFAISEKILDILFEHCEPLKQWADRMNDDEK